MCTMVLGVTIGNSLSPVGRVVHMNADFLMLVVLVPGIGWNYLTEDGGFCCKLKPSG